MSDKWMDERQRNWRERERLRDERYGREDYSQRGYRAEEGRTFSRDDYDRDHGYGAEAYADRDNPRSGYGSYRGPPPGRGPATQDYRYGAQGYGVPRWRESPRDQDRETYSHSDAVETGYGMPAAEEYYRAGYGYEPATRGAQDESPHEREQGGRGFLDRAADHVAAWFGAGREGERREGPGGFRGRGPKGYRRSDARISEDINDRLTDDPWLDASEIEVAVASGEVTLSGIVADREAKHRAERCVERVSGVEHVQNNLRIGHMAGARPFESGSHNPLTTPGRGFGDSVLEAQAKGETGSSANEPTPKGGRN
jgi:osmotically-inducible protein OsmY